MIASVLSFVPAIAAVLQHAPEHAEDESPFEVLFSHVVPQHSTEVFGLVWWNIQWFQLAAVGLIFLFFLPVRNAIREGSGGRMLRVLAGWVAWIRDEMVYANMGEKDGRRFAPYFLSIFFFIAFMNLFGLVPKGATATASVYVTAALAILTFLIMVVGGMVVQGPGKFWVSLVPSGVPGWLLPLIFVLEVAGLLIKPFALTIRLMANMVGGHLVLLSFMGLMFYFGAENGAAVGWAVAPLTTGMSVFIMIIEGFVALLQAYIFTLLSIVFVGQCLHPDH